MSIFKKMNSEIMRQIIMDNYTEPNNFKKNNDNSYLKIRAKSSTCIDEFDIYIKIKNNIIIDINFFGSGCSVSMASANIMANLLIGNKISKTKKIFDAYHDLIYLGITNDILKEANALQNTNKLSHRIKCATIVINRYKEIIFKKN